MGASPNTLTGASPQHAPDPYTTVVYLSSVESAATQQVLARLEEAFPQQPLIVLVPSTLAVENSRPSVRIAGYVAGAQSEFSWVPTAGDYLSAWSAAKGFQPRALLILGRDAESISPATLRALADAVLTGQDLVLPKYPVGVRDALVNSAILYPLTRSLYGQDIRFPLPIDVALSPRMASRLAIAAQGQSANGKKASLLWPVAEASRAGFLIHEVDGAARFLPHPAADSLNTILTYVAGSLFLDAEYKASLWQRARLTSIDATDAPSVEDHILAGSGMPDIEPMMTGFRSAYTNLRELWALVLPPNSMLALKKLSTASPDRFRMQDVLWVRIVYDFLLAHRLRTMSRTHLLGALTPLYLAWVASHLNLIGDDAVLANDHIEHLAAAFEREKPYLVARWRWPDRFNS